MKLKRIDVKVPVSTFEEIQELAVRTGARLHPVTKNPIVQDVVANLIRIGLDNYSSTEIPANQVQELEDRLYTRISESFSDNVTPSQLDHRAEAIITQFEGDIATLKQEIGELKSFRTGWGGSQAAKFPIQSAAIRDEATLSSPSSPRSLLKTLALQYIDRKEQERLQLEKQVEKQTENQPEPDSQQDTETATDEQTPQGLAQANLEPIFNEGLSTDGLATKLGMTRQGIEYRRKNGTLEQLGYQAQKRKEDGGITPFKTNDN